MNARAEIHPETGKIPADTDEQASDKKRDASFGIIVAVIGATLLWAALIGLCLYLFERSV